MGASAGLRWLAKKPPNLKEVRACLELIANNGDRANQVIDGIRAMFQKGGQRKGALGYQSDYPRDVGACAWRGPEKTDPLRERVVRGFATCIRQSYSASAGHT
jgi:hypothetical protein